MTPTRIEVPTITELVTLIWRFHAAMFCFGLLVAIPCGFLWIGFLAVYG